MIDKLKLYRGQSFDPFFNLAVEEYLLQNTDEGCCTLYLWQNQNTVVIGRNQNAFKECRTTLLEDEGGKLARRLSGGGAVFHDLGNLNFTFLVPTADYDLDKQLKVIELACEKLGVKVERSGRNDILADGRKFSGNAFYKNGPRAYHHGTLMVDVDREKMGRYLNPSKAKLSSKGVDSVRSRVVNLKELAPDTTIEMLSQELAEAFGQVYGLPYEEIGLLEKDKKAIAAVRKIRQLEMALRQGDTLHLRVRRKVPVGERADTAHGGRRQGQGSGGVLRLNGLEHSRKAEAGL